MSLQGMTQAELEVVKECMQCIADGKIIKHDVEFETIMGIDVNELNAILEEWPAVNESDHKVQAAISNSMNNLLGYTHGKLDGWEEYMGSSRDEVSRVFKKWRASHD